MPNVNEMILQGHLGRDPETRFMNDGKPVANFSVAYTEKYSGKERTSWFNCSCFGKTAEVAQQYLVKGSAPLLRGKMQSRKYTDKQGNEREAWEFVVDRILWLGPRKEGAQDNPRPAQAKPQASGGGFDSLDDEIPFTNIGRGMAAYVI